jgi:molybdopterin/thiamine biosynthesis adenylyltransferase
MKTVTIVGMGALGSHLILFGRNLGVNFRVVDFDRVESKNVQSQFHTKMGQGKNKAKAIQAALQGMFGVKISALTSKLMDNNQVQLLSESDLIVDCTDNFKAREIIQEYCQDIALPCLHGCLSADGQMARIVWTEHFAPDKEDVEGDATCEDGQNLPFHAMAGAVMAKVVQAFLESGEKRSWQLVPGKLMRLT